MKTICFSFHLHQPVLLRKYHFFNMGVEHHYLDDQANRTILHKLALQCYLPMNTLLLELIHQYGDRFRVSFSMSGLALEQLRNYAPEVLESFKALARTGCVEFLGETYSHTLASLISAEEFTEQVRKHADAIEAEFGVRPVTLRNTELIYSDMIGEQVAEMGFTTMLTEGAKHVLGRQSPNYVYTNALNPKLHLLLRNFKLSDDLTFRFANQQWNQWPLTAEKYVAWLLHGESAGEVVNLFLDYETFGIHQGIETGIFEFMRHLPGMALASGELNFATPSEVATTLQPTNVLHSPYPISWADEERDVTAWLGNELQNEAFNTLYRMRESVQALQNPDMEHVWLFLQHSDHFYYMATKWFSKECSRRYYNPYSSPYEAFINYMNILSDFKLEVEKCTELVPA